MPTLRHLAWLAVLLVAAVALVAQDSPPPPKADDPKALSFMDYDPPSTLVVPQHAVERARYPFIDFIRRYVDL